MVGSFTDAWLDYDLPEPRSAQVGATPCDSSNQCPYIVDDSVATGMYFCRDHCGLGVG